MSQKRFPFFGGTTMRATTLDRCGVPVFGDCAQVVTDGFVSVAITANYDDGTELSVTNAAGRKCAKRAARPELLNLAADLVLCDVNPDFYTMLTGFPKIIDPASGDTIGFAVDGDVLPSDVSTALEVWGDAQGDQGCGDDDDVAYAYDLLPFLQGGKVGDYTIDNNAVTFSVTGMITKEGSGWGVGPYLVATDVSGDPTELIDAVGAKQHQITFRTLVAPPEVTNGCAPLDDPTGDPATGALAGIPGHFTPVGDVRPFDHAAIVSAATTASPNTAWTTGQYVLLGDGSKTHWSATAWVAGAA